MTPPAGYGDPSDVVVVGAGPAGAMAALLLARQGVDVLLLDRAVFPRPKPCGDCLSAAATALLDRVGLLDAVRAAGASEIDHWEVVSPDGTTATGRFHDATALALERRQLDPVLLDAALAAGARFRRGHVVDLLRAGRGGRCVGVRARVDGRVRSLPARLVVGADGLRSVVARRLDRIRRPPRLSKVSLTVHLPAPDGEPGHGEMHVIPGGCVGYAPAGAGLCNLTVVVTTGHAAGIAELGPAGFIRRQVGRAPRLSARLGPRLDALDALPEDEPLASGPFDWPTRSPVAPGAALVGDAAGYYDPFTGQGIYQALAGAERLARGVGPPLAAGGSHSDIDGGLREYARAKRRLTGPTRVVQRVVEWALSDPRRADHALGTLARAPRAMDRLVQVTGDLRPPISLLSPAVLSSFLLPPTRRAP